MSLGIAFKGTEGIVLAADSRVTLTVGVPDQPLLIPATFDNATKLLRTAGQEFVGAVTYGLRALGQQQPHTAHSFIPEFEAELLIKTRGIVTFVALAASLFVILSNRYPGSDLKWAFGMVGLVVGYWLK